MAMLARAHSHGHGRFMFEKLFEIVAPVLACVAVGYAWKRAGRPFDLGMLTAIATNIAVPCLVFASLTKLAIEPAAFGVLALCAALAIAVNMAVGALVLRAAGLSLTTFLPSVAIGNSGNLGLPLCLFAFGDAGLALALGTFTVHAIFQFTLGPLIASGRFSARQMVRTPFLYVIALALALMLARISPPAWLMNAVGVLGSMAIPLMLLALGVSLASLSVAGLGAAGAVAVLRLALGFAAGVGLSEAFGLEGAAQGVLIIQCAMPAAVFNYLWAQQYGRDPGAVASVVVLSTLLGFVAIPGILAVALDPSLLPWR
jgi:hypothetical protein